MPTRVLDVVILCPTGQDSQLISKFLEEEKIPSISIRDIKDFCLKNHVNSGAFIIADEALSAVGLEHLNKNLSDQEAWSDLPIILLTSSGPRKRPFVRGLELIANSGSVSVLERPLQPLSLLSSIKVALRSRRRQFQVRDLLNTQLEATQMRDEFISIASHELKTPLTSLKLQTQMSKRQFSKLGEFSSDQLIHQFDYTINQIERLNKLVDDMLDISRITTGRLSLSKASFDFSFLVKDLIERFMPQFEAVGITVESFLEPSLPGLWDGYKIEQVLNNLFSNAIRYAPGGVLKIMLKSHDHCLRLEVADSGQGIETDNLEKIFERFERASTTRGGLGLGLYITRQIVELHDGSIRAESVPGKGATFIVELPITLQAVPQ